jgi:hypothetical protein
MTRRLVAVGIISALLANQSQAQQAKSMSAIERGELAARGRPAMNPPLWTQSVMDNAWKHWGVKEKPAEYARAFRDRYGLHAAPYENGGLPMGFHTSQSILGKGIVSDCLLCHAGRVADQTIIGLGNSSLDLQGLFDDLIVQQGFWKFPFRFSHVRGTIDVISPVAFLLELRDPDLNFRVPAKLDYVDNVCSDPPAWWLLKKKKTRNWTGAVDARAIRIDMVNILGPLNDAAYVQKQETVFADIHAFIMNTESPKYPFAIDQKLADEGRPIFNKTCAKCHGTYGPDGKYSNKVVPLTIIGTDPVLANSFTQKNVDYFNSTWFAREKGPDGKPLLVVWNQGYQAPPLDGVWATAPYFHNNSVPTIYHVINSKARPALYTRSYGTSKTDYDAVNVGVKFTPLSSSLPNTASGMERRAVYDTTLPGRSNAGHTFGDDLTEPERRAVIEYLKTL